MVCTRLISWSRHADVAQLVAHHLAKVRVAGSNPVVRSRVERHLDGGVAERRGNGLQSRVHGFKSRLHLEKLHRFTVGPIGRLAQGLARFLDMEEVIGSIPISPTTHQDLSDLFRRSSSREIIDTSRGYRR